MFFLIFRHCLAIFIPLQEVCCSLLGTALTDFQDLILMLCLIIQSSLLHPHPILSPKDVEIAREEIVTLVVTANRIIEEEVEEEE